MENYSKTYLPDYKSFLINQCANCSLFLTSDDQKVTSIRHNSTSTKVVNDNGDHFEMSNAQAISYIYGLTMECLIEKLTVQFMQQNFNNYDDNLLNTFVNLCKTSEKEATVLVFCERCALVFADLYTVSKKFRNLSDKNSIISKTLELGFDINLDGKEDVIGIIKEEPDEFNCNPTNSDEEHTSSHWGDLENFSTAAEKEDRHIKTENECIDDEEPVNLFNPTQDLVERSPSNTLRKRPARNKKQDLLARVAVPAKKLTGSRTEESDSDLFDEDDNMSDDSFVPELQNESLSEESNGSSDEDFSLNTRKRKAQSHKKSSKHPSPRKRRKGMISGKDAYVKIQIGKNSSQKRKYKYKCKECAMISDSQTHFFRHYLTQHFEGSSVHSEKIEGPPYQCPDPHCDTIYKTFYHLEHHCADAHGLKLPKERRIQKSKNELKCTECNDIGFDSSHGYVMHQLLKHGRKYFICGFCGNVFREKSELEQHKISEHPNKLSINKQAEVGADKRENNISNDDQVQYCEDIFYCRDCKCSFKSRIAFVKHRKKSHTGHQNHECKHCDESFSSLYTLITHLSDVHKLVVKKEVYRDQYKCTQFGCGDIFYTPQLLKDHRRTANHSSSCEIACGFCPKTFSDSKALIFHKHVDHKIFFCDKKRKTRKGKGIEKVLLKCKFCEETFISRLARTQHQWTHPEPEEKKEYKCKDCQLSFSDSKRLGQHRLVHSENFSRDFQCETCGKTINGWRRYRSHRNEHIEKASGVRPMCELCGKTFNTRKLLGKHIRVIHENKEKKTCPLCGYVSKTNSNMKIHLKVHEKNGILRKRKNIQTTSKQANENSQ